jgi:DNA mismatch repair protein MSH2
LEVTEEGIRIVEELVQQWSSRMPTEDGDDMPMSVDESPELQLEELRKCFAEFKPRIENNQWLQSIIGNL